MQKIKLTETIEGLNLDRKEVAETLFPANRFPMMALKRVLDGGAVLDADQISRLALFANVPVASLFTGEGWGCKSQGKKHTFTNGNFIAKIDMNEGRVEMFHKETLFHTESLISKNIELTELIEFLNKQILNYETKN